MPDDNHTTKEEAMLKLLGTMQENQESLKDQLKTEMQNQKTVQEQMKEDKP